MEEKDKEIITRYYIPGQYCPELGKKIFFPADKDPIKYNQLMVTIDHRLGESIISYMWIKK